MRRVPGRVCPGWLAALGLSSFLFGCGGPVIRNTPEYRPDALRRQRVLFVPLAVSDEFGDERTGIVLSHEARLNASHAACRHIAADWDDGTLVCPDRAKLAAPGALAELELLFARDRPIPAELLRTLNVEYKTEFALLFRPESTASTQKVTREKQLHTPPGLGMLPAPFGIAALVAGTSVRTVTTNSMELHYTISAALVSMNSAKFLKFGVNSDSKSNTVKRNLGYAEPPPVEPFLEEILLSLGRDMLDE